MTDTASVIAHIKNSAEGLYVIREIHGPDHSRSILDMDGYWITCEQLTDAELYDYIGRLTVACTVL